MENGPSKGIPGKFLIKTFQDHWKPIFGKPDKMRLDPAGSWTSAEVAQYLDDQGIEQDVIPAEAQWQNSFVERSIASIKHVMDKLVEEEPYFLEKLCRKPLG